MLSTVTVGQKDSLGVGYYYYLLKSGLSYKPVSTNQRGI